MSLSLEGHAKLIFQVMFYRVLDSENRYLGRAENQREENTLSWRKVQRSRKQTLFCLLIKSILIGLIYWIFRKYLLWYVRPCANAGVSLLVEGNRNKNGDKLEVSLSPWPL